jgi:hypothetical protein
MKTILFILFACFTTLIYGQQDSSKKTYFDMRKSTNTEVNLKIKPVKEEPLNLNNSTPTNNNNVYQNTMNGEVTIPAYKREEKQIGTVPNP